MNILAELRSRFESALHSLTDDPAPYVAMVKPAQDSRFGDFQANCAMPLAKQHKTNPRELAANILENLEVADLCDEPEIAGPGFINLRLRDDWLKAETNRRVNDDRLGHVAATAKRKFVIDYSGPNVAKPMHVGHLRSTVIGDALCRILRFVGHEVVGDNHIGDWGTQFGMIIFGYKNLLDAEAYQSDPVAELARLYRLVSQLSGYHAVVADLPKLQERLAQMRADLESQEVSLDTNNKQTKKLLKKARSVVAELAEKIGGSKEQLTSIENDAELKSLADRYPNIAADARTETAKLHTGDEENRRLWDLFLPPCLDALNAIYQRMGIEIDVTLGESFYQPMLAEVVDSLQAKGLARTSEGAMCVFSEGNDAPFIVQKSDGAFTYATTDLATIKYRCEEFKADTLLYVVDARQSEHFKLLFETAQRWGFDKVEYEHVSFGTILGEDKKPFKTRSGDTVGLESLLDEAIIRARRIVDENDDAKRDGPELDEATRAQVADIVGIGGTKYADLHHNRDSDYVFSWDKMLATNGDTATYMQYAYARIRGIFRKGNIDPDALRQSGGTIRFTRPEERSLSLQLNRFAEALDGVASEYRPNMLTQYLFETADNFMTFYNECPVLNEDDEQIRISRLLLCDLTARVLQQGLSLLGIGTCEQM